MAPPAPIFHVPSWLRRILKHAKEQARTAAYKTPAALLIWQTKPDRSAPI